MSKVVIVDIDGTVAHHTEEVRGHFEYEKVHLDEPIQPIVDLVVLLHNARNPESWSEPLFEIVFLSGREDSCRDLTWAWLLEHLGDVVGEGSTELYMRRSGDFRPDNIIKAELYERFISPREVAYVLEDRDRNVTMWRSKGLICLQVADGNF